MCWRPGCADTWRAMADLFVSDQINKCKARKLGVLLLGSWVLPQGLRVSSHNRKNKKLEKRPERQTDSRQDGGNENRKEEPVAKNVNTADPTGPADCWGPTQKIQADHVTMNSSDKASLLFGCYTFGCYTFSSLRCAVRGHMLQNRAWNGKPPLVFLQ